MTDKPSKPKNPIGRPTHYNAEIAARICSVVASNPEGLTRLCKKFPDLPSHETINEWRWKYKDFADQYALAKMHQAELMGESIEDVAQDLLDVSYVDEDGVKRLDSGMVAYARLVIDSRKWMAAKLAPKIYGEHRHQEQSNPQDTINKIRDIVNDLNKTNASDI